MVHFWIIGLLGTNFRKEPRIYPGEPIFWALERDTCWDPRPPRSQNFKLVKYGHVIYRLIAISFLVLKICMKNVRIEFLGQ